MKSTTKKSVETSTFVTLTSNELKAAVVQYIIDNRPALQGKVTFDGQTDVSVVVSIDGDRGWFDHTVKATDVAAVEVKSTIRGAAGANPAGCAGATQNNPSPGSEPGPSTSQSVRDCAGCGLTSDAEPSVIVRSDGRAQCNDCAREAAEAAAPSSISQMTADEAVEWACAWSYSMFDEVPRDSTLMDLRAAWAKHKGGGS